MWMRPEENRVEIEDFLLETFPGERVEITFPSRAGELRAKEENSQRRSLYFRLCVSLVPLVFGILMFLRVFQGDYEPFAGGVLLGVSFLTASVASLTFAAYKRRELRPAEEAPIVDEYLGITSDAEVLIARTHAIRETTTYSVPVSKVHVELVTEDESDVEKRELDVRVKWDDGNDQMRELLIYPLDPAGFVKEVRSRMSDLHAGPQAHHSPRHHHHHHHHHDGHPSDEDQHDRHRRDESESPVSEDDVMKSSIVVPIEDGSV
ncbi:Hypothetical Protein FCC1311_076032 [Hondaea fermentalgiana]|uniref:Uncharacterized protein n=1 Tax=Hondaea fermentalgiana TaxID=2315210 RepID=A0A2R5GM35_9STRA|nr:Hypothetical Protein FCC1311_076032 [Hondaea fermentalgiana]|eukprot:GBG31379.1 Hypothetical Protein FCC1311_076032 [Hondaea fermentalgiana]